MYYQTKITKSILATSAFLLIVALALPVSVFTGNAYAVNPCDGALQAYQDGADETETPECDPNAPPYETKTCPDGSTQHIDALCPNADPSAITSYVCGSGEKTKMYTAINFGCNQAYENGILDLAMAILRFLTNVVGVVLIGATMWAGIQYGASRGDPNMVGAAKKRLFNVFLSLVIFLFSYAIINFLVPGFFG